MRIPYLDLNNYDLIEEEVKIVSVHLARVHNIIAIDKIGDILNIAIPYQEYYEIADTQKLKNELSKSVGYNIQFVSSSAETIKEKRQQFYSMEKYQVK